MRHDRIQVRGLAVEELRVWRVTLPVVRKLEADAAKPIEYYLKPASAHRPRITLRKRDGHTRSCGGGFRRRIG